MKLHKAQFARLPHVRGSQGRWTWGCNAQWLSIVLGRHFKVPVLLWIYLIYQYSPKSIVESKFCAKKAISGSYGAENSQNSLKIAKNF